MHCGVTATNINLLNIQKVHEHEIAYTHTHVRGQSHRERATARAVIFIIIVGFVEFNMHDSIQYTHTYKKAVFRSSAVNIYPNNEQREKKSFTK